MNAEQHVNKIIKNTIKYFKSEVGLSVTADGKATRNESRALDRIDTKISEAKGSSTFGSLKTMAGTHILTAHYARLIQDDKVKQKHYFTLSTYHCVQAVKLACAFYKARGFAPRSVGLYDLYRTWVQCLLCGWDEEAVELGRRLYESTKASPGIWDGGGSPLVQSDHFLLELFAAWQTLAYRREDYFHPVHWPDSDEFIYDRVLPDLRSTDLQKINDAVSIMCDYHLARSFEQPEDTPEEDLDDFEFEGSDKELFPYEVLAWLEIRKRWGLKNPEKFDHPLMNQPLAAPIEGAPLPKPEEPAYIDVIRHAFAREYPKAPLPF